MNIGKRNNYLPLAPLVLLILFLVLKAGFVTSELFQWQQKKVFFRIIQNDLQVVSLVLCLSFLHVFAKGPILSLILRLPAVVMTIWYFIDVIVIIGLNSRVGLVELMQYTTQVGHTREGSFLLLVVILLAVFLIFTRIGRVYPHAPVAYLLSSVILFSIPLNYQYVNLKELASPLNFKMDQLFGSDAPKYTQKQMQQYLTTFNYSEDIFSLEDSPNIILVIVESLSAVDSMRTSGIDDFLREFDRISQNGRLFTNVLANYLNTEGSLAAYFAGYPPLQFPGSDWDVYGSFSFANHLLIRGNDLYKKVFISPSDCSFRGKRAFLKNIGFDLVLDKLNVPLFQQKPYFVFRSRPDQILYDYVLDYLDEHQATKTPLFLVLETISSHLPYTDPLGKANTAENVWSYVDNQLGRFHDLLVKRGFFENGILIITSDHRKFDPLKAKEVDYYGDTAKYRIPLAIIGKGIPQGSVDYRMLQQSDLLSTFKRILFTDKPLSESAFLVDFYRKPLFGDSVATVQVVRQQNNFKLTSCQIDYFGSNLLAAKGCEIDSTTILSFHRNNATLQYCYERKAKPCPLP